MCIYIPANLPVNARERERETETERQRQRERQRETERYIYKAKLKTELAPSRKKIARRSESFLLSFRTCVLDHRIM